MRVTIIQCSTPELLYLNTVAHKCTCGEFRRDIAEEVITFLKQTGNEEATKVDIYWHLDDYCEKKYGLCHWQKVNVETILLKR